MNAHVSSYSHSIPNEASQARKLAWEGKLPLGTRVQVYLLSNDSVVGKGEYGGQHTDPLTAFTIASSTISVFGPPGSEQLAVERRMTNTASRIYLDSGETICDDEKTDQELSKYYWVILDDTP